MPYEHWPYLGVFVMLVAASFGMPIPEDVPLLTGGYLCHAGYTSIPIMIAIGIVGVLTGDLCLFMIGRRFGHHVVEHRFIRRLIHPSRLLLAERMFARHGVKIVFIGRFLPGLRPMIFTASGVFKIRPITFLAVNGSAACISVPTMVLLGKFFGMKIVGEVRSVTHIAVIAASIIAVVAGGIYLHNRQKRIVARAGISEHIDADTFAHLPPGGEGLCPPPELTPSYNSQANEEAA